jgi:hypothetical protein
MPLSRTGLGEETPVLPETQLGDITMEGEHMMHTSDTCTATGVHMMLPLPFVENPPPMLNYFFLRAY